MKRRKSPTRAVLPRSWCILVSIAGIALSCTDEPPLILLRGADSLDARVPVDASGDAALVPAPEVSPFGGRCTESSDCPNGVECIRFDSDLILGGGPARGYCTTDCVVEDDCAALDRHAKCRAVGEEVFGYCFEGCEPGSAEPGKCHDRLELSCLESFAQSGTGACYPTCRSHADCGERFCDLGTGMCVDEPHAGLDIGALCFPEASPSECSGVCWDVDEAGENGVCTGFCTLGDIGCNAVATAELGISAACLLAPTSGVAQGDQGLCSQLCNCDDDCFHPSFQCVALPLNQAESLGVEGACRVARDGVDGIACPSLSQE